MGPGAPAYGRGGVRTRWGRGSAAVRPELSGPWRGPYIEARPRRRLHRRSEEFLKDHGFTTKGEVTLKGTPEAVGGHEKLPSDGHESACWRS